MLLGRLLLIYEHISEMQVRIKQKSLLMLWTTEQLQSKLLLNSMRIKIHFYKWTHFFSQLIQWRSFSEYSHVSIQIMDTIYEAKERVWVVKSIARETPPDSLFDTLEVSIPHDKSHIALGWLESRLWCSYDYLGVLWFLWWPRRPKTNKKYFCSELVTEFLETFGIIDNQKVSLSPWSLYLLLK